MGCVTGVDLGVAVGAGATTFRPEEGDANDAIEVTATAGNRNAN